MNQVAVRVFCAGIEEEYRKQYRATSRIESGRSSPPVSRCCARADRFRRPARVVERLPRTVEGLRSVAPASCSLALCPCLRTRSSCQGSRRSGRRPCRDPVPVLGTGFPNIGHPGGVRGSARGCRATAWPSHPVGTGLATDRGPCRIAAGSPMSSDPRLPGRGPPRERIRGVRVTLWSARPSRWRLQNGFTISTGNVRYGNLAGHPLRFSSPGS